MLKTRRCDGAGLMKRTRMRWEIDQKLLLDFTHLPWITILWKSRLPTCAEVRYYPSTST